MTETEWLDASDPSGMLVDLKGASDRKLRLFACACVRRVWNLLTDARSRNAIEVAEKFADGLVDDAAWAAAWAAAGAAAGAAAWAAAWAASRAAAWDASEAAAWAAARAASRAAAWDATRAAQANILRDVFGCPFRPVAFDSRFRTPLVLSLAQAAYDERPTDDGALDHVRLLVLADALEEAGAHDAILEHLRSPGPHVRGCWALDLILGKE